MTEEKPGGSEIEILSRYLGFISPPPHNADEKAWPGSRATLDHLVVAMAGRNAPGMPSPHQSSSSQGPLAGTTGSGSVRSRNRRLPDDGSSRANLENVPINHGEILRPAQRSAPNAKSKESTPGLGQVLGDSWSQSWSSVQGFAASLLSVSEGSGSMPRPRSDFQSEDDFPSSLWNRVPPSTGGVAGKSPLPGNTPVLPGQRTANRVATGSSDERDAALKTAKRASILENNPGPSGGLNNSGKYKRRTSDEIASENSQPEEYFVYVHKVLPTDTYAGIILRYKCMEDAFRKANGLWSRDSIQVRKWVIIPVDACEVRGRPCDPKPSSERAAQEDESAEREIMPWLHVKWVMIDSLPEPVEIGRIARQTMGYFPPRRKKTGRAISFSSTPRESFEASTTVPDQIEQPPSGRQSSADDQPLPLGRRESSHNHGDDEAPDMRPMWMRRPGGVGSMGRNIRAPGPDKDYLNSWAKKHIPGLHMDDLPSMSIMGSEMARFGFGHDVAGIVEGSFREERGTTSPRHQSNGLDKAAAAVETWLRTAWSKRPIAPLIGGIPRSGSTAGQDVGDLIELTSTAGSESTPHLEMFDSQTQARIMRDRPAAANRVTKPSRNGSRRANAKAKSLASTFSKGPRKDKREIDDIAKSPDSSIASGVDDETSTLDQSKASKASKPTRGRPKASKDQNSINSSAARVNEQGALYNTGDTEDKGGSKDEDGDGDDIRRQLSELRQSYSKLETRYRDLQELGVKKAEQNFELLKAQADENTRVADELIAQLKEEVAEQSKAIQQAETLRSQLVHSEAEVDALRAQVLEADQSLSQTKSEMKTLYTKLAASRHAEPNSKGPATGNRAAPGGSMQTAQVKEDLYADLTGLIVRDVRRIDKEDVFDCIQTGRNGTLHFKLALEDMDAAYSYEDVQFTYRPQLDPGRDGDLIQVLPDYLIEEITFPRHQASKFYARVMKSLMERLD
ncbi:hypothetical protein Trco_004196 [Trichoderma cornu-damae]|uniref:Monopolin complex subunit Csm1/Pcs1 C-terminal domain-containing protein n=1 Tax=Trichoderma cornu-damae TaxID=654480 RepID=A0A9P8TWW2_9HYPO|nr:hypothetical protein Trco_004196 [Trichoderma cornu-damae]